MIVISDSSPIICLDKIGLLNILKTFNHRIIVPQAVYDEIVERASDEFKKADWIHVRSCKNQDLIHQFSQNISLHQGEIEALALSKELNARYLIIDELKGRKIATENNIQVIGILGVLIKVKNKNVIERVGPILDRIINDTDFRIDDNLRRQILQIANEL